MRLAPILAVATVLFLASCGDGGGDSEPPPQIEAPADIEVRSGAFGEGDTIPTKYTCDGADVSPPLAWTDAVDAGGGYVVTLTDPDAPGGTFTHWIVDLPPSVTALEEGSVPNDAILGDNDFGEADYGGPCPPEGDDPHRYVFSVYAYDGLEAEELSESGSLSEVLDAIECCVSAKGTLTATYGR